MNRDDPSAGGVHGRRISCHGLLTALVLIALVVAAGMFPEPTTASVEALGGGCDAFMCGTNHNQALV